MSTSRRAYLVVLPIVAMVACGGGGGSSPMPIPVQAPSALTYGINPAVYTKGTAVAPNQPSSLGGAIASYAVTPPLPAGLSLNPTTGVVTGTPTALAPMSAYVVTATNASGSTPATLTLTVKDAAPSSLTFSAATALYTVGTAIAPNAPTSTGGAVVSYSVAPTLPIGLSLNPTTGVISGTPSAITALAVYTVIATNTGGSTQATLALTVNAVAPTGLGYSAATAIYTVGTAIAPNVPSSGGGTVVTYSVAPPLPAGLSLNPTTGVISGTPSAPLPATTYVVTALNSGGPATASLNLTVKDRPPAFSYSLGSATFGVGLPITPLDPASTGGAVVAWLVTPGLPPGLSLDPATGTISGTPTAGAAPGTYTILATNSGGTLGQDLILTVLSGAPIISAFQANPTTTTYGGSVALGWTLTGGTVAATTLDLDGSPATGLLSGSTSVAPARRSTYTLSAANLMGTTTRATTVAAKGLDLVAGNLGGAGSQDGPLLSARFNSPGAAAMDASGTLYIADNGNHTIRKISAGVVTTFAGTPGVFGSADGTGTAAQFRNPSGLAVDGSGNVYVSDTYNYTIRKITPAGVVTTLAGTPNVPGAADGTGAAARFAWPYRMVIDGTGTLIVADVGNKTLRKVTSAGVVTTFVGTTGVAGSADGTGTAAQFNRPADLALDASGNLYVADDLNNTIRKVSSSGVVTTLAGQAGVIGSSNGTGTAARFYYPSGLAVSAMGDIYVAEVGGNVIRKVTPAGVVTTAAGAYGSPGSVDGPATSARFQAPNHLLFLPSGDLLVVDGNNHTLRTLSPANMVATFAGAPPLSGTTDGTGASARFNYPTGVAVNAAGDAFVADQSNHTIRKITSAGGVTTFVDATAGLFWPSDMTIDPAGNLYVVSGDYTVKKITPAGAVSILAGSSFGSGSADGAGAAAQFLQPRGIGIDPSGNLYVADSGNHTIRKITQAGVVSTFAGTAGTMGSSDGTGAAATFNAPTGITVDAAGNVYVGDTTNNQIRKITPAGVVTRVAGGGGSGYLDGPMNANLFSSPGALACDAAGNIYVCDRWNQVIRKVTSTGDVTTPVGIPFRVGAMPGLFPGGVSFPNGLAFTPAGDLLITTAGGLMQATLPD